MRGRVARSLWPAEVDAARPGVVISLFGCVLALGAVLALLAGFALPYRVASHVAELTVWLGPMSALIVIVGALLTRAKPRLDDWRLARLGLLITLVIGPITWIALFVGRVE